MSDEQLIREHAHAWKHWVDCRKRFGELGTPDDGKQLTALEMEARRRGISDERLMAAVPEEYR